MQHVRAGADPPSLSRLRGLAPRATLRGPRPLDIVRRIMQANRSKGTRPEAALGLILSEAGIRFKRHNATVPGTPGFVIAHPKAAIFVDDDLWHGYRFGRWKDQLSDYWIAKIQRNRVRDRKTFATLRRRGWKVIRVWEHQLADPPKVLGRILASLACAADERRVRMLRPQRPGSRKRQSSRRLKTV